MNTPEKSPLVCFADFAMLSTNILWGLGAVVVKNAIGDTPDTFRVFVFNGLRMPLVVLLLFGGLKIAGRPVALKRRDIPFVAILSFGGMFLHIVTSLAGLTISTASNMGVIISTVPLFVLLVSFFLGIENPTPKLVAGIIIGMAGVLTLTWKDGAISFNAGDLLFLASNVFWAIHTVFGKRLMTITEPVTAIAWIFLFCTAYQFPLFIYQLSRQTWETISAASWINFAVGTVGSYAIANSLYAYAIKKIGPIRVGLYNNLTPVFTLLFAYFLIGEQITTLKIVGLVIILAGVGITKLPSARRMETAKEAAL